METTKNKLGITNKKCKSCGKEFIPKKHSQESCSRKCGYKVRRNPNELRKKKFGWYLGSEGYIQGRVRLDNGEVRYYKQHRWIVENHYGIKLTPQQHVHHINRIKTDNRIENLQIISPSEHGKLTHKTRVYKRGYKLNLSKQQRQKRSFHSKKQADSLSTLK